MLGRACRPVRRDALGKGRPTLKSTLCIISAYRPDLMDHAVRAFGAVGNVQVVMDRRLGERRRSEVPSSRESRSRDRRQRDIDERLRTQGFAIVPSN